MNEYLKNWWPVGLVIVSFLVFGVATGTFTYKGQDKVSSSPDANLTLKYGNIYSISKMEVFNGRQYDISLSEMSGNVYNVYLNLPNQKNPVIGAGSEVRAFINEKMQSGYKGYFQPSLYEYNVWHGDIFLEKDGEKINLSDWLEQNNLLYSN